MQNSGWKGKDGLVGWILSFGLLLGLIGIPLSLSLAAEEAFPNRPINLVISMAPGGGLDMQAKIVGDRLAEVLGQPILRVHKPGGGGTLAATFAARSKPDGYTLFTATSSNIILPPALKKIDYTWDDFIPLGIYCKGVIFAYVKSDSPWKTLQDFVAEGKKRTLKASSYGKNSHPDFVIEVFRKQAGVKLSHIPYKGCGEAMTAVLGGHVDADFCPTSMGQVAAGAVRILAVADNERSKLHPEVKTFKELGYPVALPLLYSFVVPKKTPQRIVEILANGLQEVYNRHGKEIQEELMRIEFSPSFHDLKQSAELFRQDFETTSKIARELGVAGK